MARMHEIIDDINIPAKNIPDLWEPYFIAAMQKYARAEETKKRFERQWFRQLNRWLNLEDRHMDALLSAARAIADDEQLYEWSQFVRYLIFDTKIIRDDEKRLEALLPEAEEAQTEDLFFLIAILSGADRIISRYKLEDFEGKEIEAVFALIPQMMDRFYHLNKHWGLKDTAYLTRLARSSLWVFESIAFEYAAAELPGDIYRNLRSGEWVMVAAPQELYNKKGRRLPAAEEAKLLHKKQKTALLIDESSLEHQEENALFKTVHSYPDDIWESRFFHTETGGFVGNALGPDGLAHSAMRIFEAGHWERRVDAESSVLHMYVSAEDAADQERVEAAVEAALEKAAERGRKAEAVLVESWVLDPAFNSTLDEEDPLRLFAEHFRLFPLPASSKEALEEVFGSRAAKQPQRLWPEDEPLQILLKSLRSAGVRPQVTGGYMIPEKKEHAEEDEK